MAANGVIGRAGTLPWHLPEDLRRFKAQTMGKPVLMGRRTYQSIGRPLPGRLNIVVSRDPAFRPDGVTVVRSFEAGLAHAQAAAAASGASEIAVIGGAAIYARALPVADRIYLTEVHAEVEGDTFFPTFDRTPWTETAREAGRPAGDGAPSYSFVVLDRRR